MLNQKFAKVFFGFFFILFLTWPLAAQTLLRSFDELFPGLSESNRSGAFSQQGVIRTIRRNGELEFIPVQQSGIDIYSRLLRAEPSFIAEALHIIPYSERTFDRLDIYNAIGRIGDLKGRLYHSRTRQAEVPLFEEATRIDSLSGNNPIPDPPPANVLPSSEIVHMRLKDINFGDTFYQVNMNAGVHGITCSLINTKNISYLFFPAIKEGRFLAAFYVEPLREGVLIYSMAGADASDFVAAMIDIPSSIRKRLEVFIAWIVDGLKATL